MKAITIRRIAAVLAHVDAHPLPVITLAPVQVVATKPAEQRDVEYGVANIGQD